MTKTYTTRSTQQTQNIAKALAEKLRGGEVITLSGDLGTGKTTFTQGLAKALGVASRVNSPTFIIHRSYVVTHPTMRKLHHIDLYRIEGEADLDGLGFEELLRQKNEIVIIEWPEKIASLLPKERIDIQFEYISENERGITIQN